MGDELLGTDDIESIQKGQLETEGFEQDHKMLGDPGDIAFLNLAIGYSQTEQTFEQNVQFGRPPEDDIGEIRAFLFQLQHHIHQGGQLTPVLTGDVDDILADGIDPLQNVIVGCPGIIRVLGEHMACNQLDRIVIDLFLVFEVLVDGGTGDTAFGSDQ